MLLIVIINGNEQKEKFSVGSLLSYQVMTLIATSSSPLILFIYCSTLKWVDINIIQSGRIKGDKVITSGKTAVCRFVFCKM